MKKIIVLAFKFNDIFYSISTAEFNASDIKIVILLSEKIEKHKFPYLDLFNKVYYYKVPALRILQVGLAFKIIFSHKKEIKNSVIFLANPYLLLTQLIFILGKASSGIMIEDGIMNYYQKKELHNFKIIRKAQDKWLEYSTYWKRFKCTYLLSTDKAIVYLGELRRLNLNHSIENKKIISVASRLNDMSVLIGGGTIEHINVNDKEKIIREICRKYKIDYYLPHHTDIIGLCGQKTLDINDFGLTLEMIYRYCRGFKLYSFGSSAAFNAFNLNSNIQIVYLRMDAKILGETESDRLMMKSAQEVININDIELFK